MIRKISLVVFLVMGSSSTCFSMGTIHLFADTLTTSISADIAQYETCNIWIGYSATGDDGLDCIAGLEFMVHWDAPYLLESDSPVFDDIVSVTMGQISTGISIALSREVYVTEEYYFFGYFSVFGLQNIISGSDPVVLSVVANPYNDYDAPIVAACDNVASLHEVRGRKFVFPYEAQVIGTGSMSWGAIKSLLEQE